MTRLAMDDSKIYGKIGSLEGRENSKES
jgi:hypothetical protein